MRHVLLGDNIFERSLQCQTLSQLVVKLYLQAFQRAKVFRGKGLLETPQAAFLGVSSPIFNFTRVKGVAGEGRVFIPAITLVIRGTCFMDNNLKLDYKQIKSMMCQCVINKQLQLLANSCCV